MVSSIIALSYLFILLWAPEKNAPESRLDMGRIWLHRLNKGTGAAESCVEDSVIEARPNPT